MCLPIGLGLWGSYSDIAHGLSFGHCLLVFLFSSPSWVLSKEQSSGFPDLMRFYSALGALLFIEVSRRRAHNWCSPEQMFFREGCCLQTVPKISVTSREIWGQMLVFYGLNDVTSTFIKVTPCLLVSFQSGRGRKTQAEFGISKLQPFGGKGLDFWDFSPHPSNFIPLGFGSTLPGGNGSEKTGYVLAMLLAESRKEHLFVSSTICLKNQVTKRGA